MNNIINFKPSFSQFDLQGRLVDWNAGFEQEFFGASEVIRIGASAERIRNASLLPERALDLSWLQGVIPPPIVIYVNNRRTIEVTQEKTKLGQVLRLAHLCESGFELHRNMPENATELLRSSSLQMSAAILNLRSREADGLQKAREDAEIANFRLNSLLKFTETIISNSPLPIGVYAADGQCVEANEAYAKLAGASRAALLAQNFHRNEVWRKSGLLRECLAALEQNLPRECEVETITSFGLYVATVCRISPILINDSMHLIIQIVDLTERKRIEEELRKMAFHDTLTRLPNRRLLMDRLQQALYRAKRNTRRVAMLFLDMNQFKQLNDLHGHDAGDQLLIEVAQRLRLAVRERDTVARLGGDEFVVLLEGLHPDSERIETYLSSIIAKIRAVLNQDYKLGELSYPSSVSIGVKLIDSDESDLDQIIRAADIAMYEDKRRQLHL